MTTNLENQDSNDVAKNKGPEKKQNFFVEKIVPNIIIWFAAYILIDKFGRFISDKKIQWENLLDPQPVVAFAIGALGCIVIAWLIKSSGYLPWFMQKIRDEISNAAINISSIAIIIGIFNGRLIPVLIGVAGFILAPRIL